MHSTVACGLSRLCSFYRYCHLEGILACDPAANVRRPKVDPESWTLLLGRNELGALLVQAGLAAPRDHALISLLAMNGLRYQRSARDRHRGRGRRPRPSHVAGGADGRHAGHHSTRPRGPLERSICTLGDRATGPIFLGDAGARMDRYGADDTLKRVVRRTGITKRISPRGVRHSFITAALYAGVQLRDVQEAAPHAGPRTTIRYDRVRRSLDRHATYIVAAFLAGAAH
jgi:site-specific recombinase XerD